MKVDNIFILILIGMLGILLFSIGNIYVSMTYRRKIERQKREAEKAELEYESNLLTTTIASQEVERRKIGRELHDDIGSTLAALKHRIGSLNGSVDSQFNKENIAILDRLALKVKDISHLLLPPELELFGFDLAIENLCETFNNKNNVLILLNNESSGIMAKANSKITFALYRIFQELITNTIRHAKASKIMIEVKNQDESLIIEYSDNGIGFDDSNYKKDSLGLHNIKSRLLLIGAKHKITTSVSHGFKITIYLAHGLVA